ncbi:MAG: sporulation integral membrane protein YtvI [Eubacterium sp.]
MSPKVEKRREFLINLVFVIAVLGLLYVYFKYLFWITAPFIFAFLLAIVLQKPLRLLDKKTKNKYHGFWSILLVILSICVIIIPLGFLISALITKVIDFAKYLLDLASDLPTLLTTLEDKLLSFGKFLPQKAYESYSTTISIWFNDLLENSTSKALSVDFNTIKSGVTTGVSGVVSVVKNIPSILIAIVISVIAWIFMTKDYNKIVRFIQLQMPEEKRNLPVEIKQVFTKNVLRIARAYGLIMCITFFELFLGFSILKLTGIMTNKYFVWIAVGTAIFDILPVAGSGGVLIPWMLYSMIDGNYKQAIGLLIIYVVISVIRQYIEPRIVGGTLGIHPLITLSGMYIGLKLFGFIGIFAVPIVVVMLKAFNDTGRIKIWNTEANQRN